MIISLSGHHSPGFLPMAKQLNENYTNQQKDYQIIGYLDQIQQRKLKIPESFLVKFNLSDMVEFSQLDRVCHHRLPLSLQNSL